MPDFADFGKAEFDSRVASAKKAMEQRHLDALILTEWENIYYLTSFQSVGFAVTKDFPYALILKKDGDATFVVRGGFGEVMAKETAWITNIRGYRSVSDGLDTITKAIVEAGLKGAKVGAELGETQAIKFSTGLFLELVKRSGLELVDGAEAIWDMRMFKSKLEIDRIRRAAKIASKAAERAFLALHAGMTERDFARIVQRNILEEGGDRSAWIPIIQSGEKFTRRLAGSFPNDRKIQPGDYVEMDFGAEYKHYFSDLNRIALVDAQPSQSARDHWETYREANRAAIKAVRPGSTASDVLQAIARVFEEAGTKYAGFRAGHGLGLELHEPPNITLSDNRVIKPGMVLSIEPFGVENREGLAFNCEDNVVCTESGAEILSTIPREIFLV